MKAAFTFPGQGSQSIGMLAELAQAYPEVGATFDEASEVLGRDLWTLVQRGPEEALNLTENTQPAMLAGGVAVARVFRSRVSLEPTAMAGHSLGEYSALVIAGSLGFAHAVGIVATRARLMQAAVAPGAGAVAAVLGLDDEQVVAACERAALTDGVVSAANFNSPGQVVIAGASEAVDKALSLCEAAGAKRALRLPLSVPVHCALMEGAARELGGFLADVELLAPHAPVIHNVDVRPRREAAEIRRALAEQVHKPVLWAQTVRTLASMGIDTLVELGPGKVLSGLAKRIDRSLEAFPVMDLETLEKAVSRCR